MNNLITNYKDNETGKGGFKMAKVNATLRKEKTWWDGANDEDALFIREVTENGTKGYSQDVDTGEEDAPYRVTEYEYDGKKYYFNQYHHYPDGLSLRASTKKSKSQPITFNDMVKKQRNKNLKKGGIDSRGVEFVDTNMKEYANDIIDFANNIINLEAEIKAEYERTSEMPHYLMEQLFNNIYSLEHYKKLLDGEYSVWLARYGIEG